MTMTKEMWITGLAGVLIGIVLNGLFSPMWSGMMGYRNGGLNTASPMTRAIDSHFIEQMIPHHQDAITMADIALEKAQHTEIKQLARDIQRTQSEEIVMMQQWYRAWFGQEVPDTFASLGHGMGSGAMHMGIMGDATDIDRLNTASDFDKAFIEEMIPHHQMAVMMAQMLARTTDRPEMKQLAKDIIEAQTREINSMREWYRAWYGR